MRMGLIPAACLYFSHGINHWVNNWGILRLVSFHHTMITFIPCCYHPSGFSDSGSWVPSGGNDDCVLISSMRLCVADSFMKSSPCDPVRLIVSYVLVCDGSVFPLDESQSFCLPMQGQMKTSHQGQISNLGDRNGVSRIVDGARQVLVIVTPSGTSRASVEMARLTFMFQSFTIAIVCNCVTEDIACDVLVFVYHIFFASSEILFGGMAAFTAGELLHCKLTPNSKCLVALQLASHCFVVRDCRFLIRPSLLRVVSSI